MERRLTRTGTFPIEFSLTVVERMAIVGRIEFERSLAIVGSVSVV